MVKVKLTVTGDGVELAGTWNISCHTWWTNIACLYLLGSEDLDQEVPGQHRGGGLHARHLL